MPKGASHGPTKPLAVSLDEQLLVRRANGDDLDAVVRLATNLYDEIGHDCDEDAARRATQKLIASESSYHALLAFLPDSPRAVGLLALAQTCATYAVGHFGIIQEFYVEPELRSRGVGSSLLASARALAAIRGWTRLEVTAPFGERFRRSQNFYRENGFRDSGPRLFLAIPTA